MNHAPQAVAPLFLRSAGRRLALLLALVSWGRAVPAQTFGPPTDYPTGLGPFSVALGDVNGDGRLDLATANFLAGTVSVLLGTSAGAFGPNTDFPTRGIPRSVALGDVNGDGRLDVVTANYDDAAGANAFRSSVSVLLGTGTGTFGPHTDYPTGNNPLGLALGDVNGDGRLDLVTANQGDNSAATVSVLLGTGTGAFGPKTDFLTQSIPRGVALGDVNGDGRPDVVTANAPAANTLAATVSVLLGTGTGAFGPHTDYPTGNNPFGLALGDVNGDGRLDVATANYGAGSVSVLVGTGTGAFGPHTDYPTGGIPRSVALGDVNGDGRLDLVAANMNASRASVLLGTGTGTFGPQTDYLTGDNSYSVALGDVNGDGRLDLVTANFGPNSVSVLLNLTPLNARADLAAAGGALYPNPARAGFAVRLPAGAGPAGSPVHVALVNVLGQVVRRHAAALPAAGAALAVDAAGLPAGVYTLRLLVGTTALTHRVVLE